MVRDGERAPKVTRSAGRRESIDPLWLLRKLQGWDEARLAGHSQHRFSVEMRTEYGPRITNKDGSPRVRKQRFKLVPSGVVLGLEKYFDLGGRPYPGSLHRSASSS